MDFSVNLLDYDILEALRTSHISGNPYRHKYLGCLTSKYLKTYLGGLKPYLQKELNLHDIPNLEVTRHKAKAT